MTMPNGHPHEQHVASYLKRYVKKAIAEEKFIVRMGDRRDMNMKNI